MKTINIPYKVTIPQIVSLIKNFLEGKVENPLSSAEYIISEIFKIPIPELYLLSNVKITAEKKQKILSAMIRRAKNEPLQYIFGKAYFRNLILKVGRGTLIPRPETELIVDEILKNLPYNGSFCDIGTGSGAIALAVASERPDAMTYASEISAEAIKYARINQKKAKLKNIQIRKGYLFSPFKKQKFNVIAANLPYIKRSDFYKLPCEIRNFEPAIALIGGKDGLDIIKKFFQEAVNYSVKNTFIIAEIAPEQTDTIKTFLTEMGVYKDFRVIKDLSGNKRFISVFCS